MLFFEESNVGYFFLSTGGKIFPEVSAEFFHLYQKS